MLQRTTCSGGWGRGVNTANTVFKVQESKYEANDYIRSVRKSLSSPCPPPLSPPIHLHNLRSPSWVTEKNILSVKASSLRCCWLGILSLIEHLTN